MLVHKGPYLPTPLLIPQVTEKGTAGPTGLWFAMFFRFHPKFRYHVHLLFLAPKEMYNLSEIQVC